MVIVNSPWVWVPNVEIQTSNRRVQTVSPFQHNFLLLEYVFATYILRVCKIFRYLLPKQLLSTASSVMYIKSDISYTDLKKMNEKTKNNNMLGKNLLNYDIVTVLVKDCNTGIKKKWWIYLLEVPKTNPFRELCLYSVIIVHIYV